MWNPERIGDNNLFEAIDLNQAYKQARLRLAKDAIKLDRFRNVPGYGEGVVHLDTEEVRNLEVSIERGIAPEEENTRKLSTIFEAVIHENAELSEWPGPEAQTIKSSRYDDIKNGVDTIVEFEEPDRSTTHLALAIDVAMSGSIEKKFDRIKQEIREGRMAEVKYFASDTTDPGPLHNVPRIVIGADGRTVNELANLWLEGSKRELGKHPIQFQILEEIIMQLTAFEAYAQQEHKLELAKEYERTRLMVEEIYDDKKLQLEDTGVRDRAFSVMQEDLRTFAY